MTDSDWPRCQAFWTMLVWLTLATCWITLSSQRRSTLLLGRQLLQVLAVFIGEVANAAQPAVDQAELVVCRRGAHAAAAVVAGDQDVLDLEHVDGELDHRQALRSVCARRWRRCDGRTGRRAACRRFRWPAPARRSSRSRGTGGLLAGQTAKKSGSSCLIASAQRTLFSNSCCKSLGGMPLV